MIAHLLIGLGNPGPRYAGNRHNIGFLALDAIAHAHGFGAFQPRMGSLAAEGKIDGRKCWLLKPQSFMNLSGQPVGEFARFYKIPPAQITVFHDELDLPFGKLRVKRGGGHGGHNGLKSLDAHLGQEYQRVRLGIGHPGERELVSPYVLSDFAKAEQAPLADWLARIAREVPVLLEDNAALFQTRLADGQKKPQPVRLGVERLSTR